MTTPKLCPKCDQPIKPGRHKDGEYRHAQGCPNDRSTPKGDTPRCETITGHKEYAVTDTQVMGDLVIEHQVFGDTPQKDVLIARIKELHHKINALRQRLVSDLKSQIAVLEQEYGFTEDMDTVDGDPRVRGYGHYTALLRMRDTISKLGRP